MMQRLPLVLLSFHLAATAVAQEPREPPASAAAEIEARIENALLDAEDAFFSGDFHAATDRYENVLEFDSDHRNALRGLADCHRLLGRLDEEEALLRRLVKLEPDDLDLRCALGDSARYRGRLDEAERLYRSAVGVDPEHYRARVALGDLLRERGRDEDADRQFRVLANHAATHYVEEADRLAWLARAYQALGGFEEAAEALGDAIRADAAHVDARRFFADLLREKYQTGDALTEYRLALEIFPNHPDLLYGIALTYFAREQSFRGIGELERVLEIHPRHTGALARMAQVFLEDHRFEEAKERIEEILAINPNHKHAIALRAAYHYVTNRLERFEEDSRRVLSIDPTYARLYLTVAQVLGGLYRFADGLPFAEKAIELDPELWEAYDTAGRFCFNTGAHERGLAYLEKAQKGDNFRYPWRLNMIEVASIFDEFVERTGEHFQLYVHVDENEVFRGYLRELLERAYDDLTARYRFDPVSPTIVEVFPEQNDFAVRNVGATGIDYILGICFGRVITMNSPRAKPAGFFSWAQTAWHEFAHVLTLQITRARIPRWLTEGISVYEERRAQPIWERRQEQELLDAYHNDKIFPLRELNGAFRTPRIGFAYYQGSLLVEHIEERYGFDAVLEILRLYGRDLSTEQILLEVLRLEPEQFDEQFLAFVRDKVERFRVIPRWDRDRLGEFRDRADLEPDDPDLQAKLAWAYYFHGGGVDCEAALGRALEADADHALANLLRGVLAYDADRYEQAEKYLTKGLKGGAEDAFARLRLAQIYERDGRIEDAVREYKRAKRDFPYYVGPGNPYARLEQIYEKQGDRGAALREIRAYAELVNTDIESRRKLVRHYRDAGDPARARTYLEELLWIDPFALAVHAQLAEVYSELERPEEAIRELRAAVALAESDEDRVEFLEKLAEAERKADRIDDARFHLEEALRLAPDRDDLRAKLEGISSP